MENLISLPTDRLLAKFGSGGHKPGSGSAAALLALVACKLVQTVVALSNGRADYAGVKDQLTLANQTLVDSDEPFFLRALQDDSELFARVIAARRERDAATDPRERRRLAEHALDELRKATELPVSIAQHSLRLAETALAVFDLGFRSARGDSGVAISAALAAASGSLSIVYLNLTSFKGSEWARKARADADALTERMMAMQVQLVKRIDQLREEAKKKEGEPGATDNPGNAK